MALELVRKSLEIQLLYKLYLKPSTNGYTHRERPFFRYQMHSTITVALENLLHPMDKV